MDIDEEALKLHKKIKGKLSISLNDQLDSQRKLSLYYTPGVAAVSRHTHLHPESTRDYTWTNNTVAIVSDGSAVLGLGDIGPYGALPVMEGKSMLFKHFAGINGVPIVLNVHSVKEIVETVKAIAPGFGGINLEDIAAPKCFEIEKQLIENLDIPVMHDDQHGTAVVVLAGLINALKITSRELSKCKIVCAGAGAAGSAITKLIYKYAKPEILVVDSEGMVSSNRLHLSKEKSHFLSYTNSKDQTGSLEDAVKEADIFIGVSKANTLTPEMVESMNKDAIVFAMANPNPEIMPEDAKKAGARIVATGRSDFPNQINNALAFPGIFRGALDNNVTKITDEHKVAAAEALASLVKRPSADHIIPSVFDKQIVPAIAAVIR
ncbi:MAG TPA: NADP-dependent malic enzyme [Candidatus Babeliales bacterium]|nr:NADP-dependent malic enzyme [Candidatus Babeliales bacterium]